MSSSAEIVICMRRIWCPAGVGYRSGTDNVLYTSIIRVKLQPILSVDTDNLVGGTETDNSVLTHPERPGSSLPKMLQTWERREEQREGVSAWSTEYNVYKDEDGRGLNGPCNSNSTPTDLLQSELDSSDIT